MALSIATRVPVVGSLAYAERLRPLPASFSVTLAVEANNRYFRHAIAVLANGLKVGYVAPEVAPTYYESVKSASRGPTCPARRASRSDHDTSGVELLLDLSGLAVPTEP